MTKYLVCLFFAAALAAANPVFLSFLSEVSVDSTHQFVEFHCGPFGQPADLNGWQLVTSTSTCTLACQLQGGGFLAVDSEALALGDIGHGTLRLNPSEDRLILFDCRGMAWDSLQYPGYGAPLPPSHGSIAFWNHDDYSGQSRNWYIDSTPTPGSDNDDYSSIAGTVTGTGGITLDDAGVYAQGTGGYGCFYQQTGYTIGGLGAGTYAVSAWGHYNSQYYEGVYPESVTVGYSQEVVGIDFAIPPSGVAETQSAPLLPLVRVSGRALLLSGNGTARVNVQLYNQVGSRVGEFRLSPFNGEKRIELPATLAPGIYFANCRFGERTLKTKLVLY
jgi:hypothetical protein